MKSIFTLCRIVIVRRVAIALILLQLSHTEINAQICASPSTIIYGLTSNGAIYPVNVTNASVGTIVKSTTYSGNGANTSNGLAYASTIGRFYYFKRNISAPPQEFVYFDPLLNTVVARAASPCTGDVHTGAINALGTAYYTIDINAGLSYYNILSNNWKAITSNFVDQFGANVSTIIQNQSAGDIAFDAAGNLWIVTSSNSNWGLYKLSAPLPTGPKASVTVTRIIAPTRATPNGNSIAGIAFNPAGQIFMSTRSDDRLYRLNANLTTTLIGTMSISDLGNDLTSCAFPLNVLPIKWLSFDASLMNDRQVKLDWNVAEENVLGFFVQHSTDGGNWTDLSYIEGNGHGASTQLYSYTHYSPAAGKNYYRVKMVDAERTESYTPVKMITVKTSSNSDVSIWPNPATDKVQVNVAGQNGMMNVRIFDLSGKMQLQKQLPAGETTIIVSSLQQGTYIMSISFENGNISNQKFIKH